MRSFGLGLVIVLVATVGCGGTEYGPPNDATHILIDEQTPAKQPHSRLQILGLQATFTHSTTNVDEKSATMTLDSGRVADAIAALADVDFLAKKPQPELACPGGQIEYPFDTVTVDLTPDGSNMLKVRLDCTSGVFTDLASADQRIFGVTGFADWITANFP